MGLIKQFKDYAGNSHQVHTDGVKNDNNQTLTTLLGLKANSSEMYALLDEKADLDGATFTGVVKTPNLTTAHIETSMNNVGLVLIGNTDEDYPSVILDGDGGIRFYGDDVSGDAIADTAALLNAGGAKIPTAGVVKDALDSKAPINNPSFTGNVNIGGGLTVGNGSVHGNGYDESLYLASHGESAYIDLTEDGGAGAIELNAATVKGSAVADTAAKLEAGGAKIPTAEVIKDALDGKLSLLDSFEITNSGIYGVITGTVGNINTYLLLVSVSTRSSAGQPSTVIRKQTRISDSIESRTKVNDGEWSEWE